MSGKSFSENLPKQPSKPAEFILMCRICGKPVSVSNANTDGDGKAVHGECYAQTFRKGGHVS